MKSSVIVLSLLATALLTGAVAQADVIFDNFGPSDAYNISPAPRAVYDTDFASSGALLNEDVFTQFGTVATTRYLTSVDIALRTTGVTDTAYIYLMTGSPIPDAIVAVATYIGLPVTAPTIPPISVPFDSFELIPGEIYWINVSTVDVHGSEMHWGTNSIGMTGGYGQYVAVDSESNWTLYESATPAMRVHVAPEAVENESESWGGVKALYR
ncbi:MAG: hypothetical protein ACI9UK_001641 [Candidatus Krumholzibacteriia bacterium]|jgi:hypothetical protein